MKNGNELPKSENPHDYLNYYHSNELKTNPNRNSLQGLFPILEADGEESRNAASPISKV